MQKDSYKKRKIGLLIITIFLILIGVIILYFILHKNNFTEEEQKTNNSDIKESIIDKEEIKLELKNLIIKQDTEYSIESFIEKCESLSSCKYEYETDEMASYKELGIYKITIIAFDEKQNKTKAKTTLKIISLDESLDDNADNTDKEEKTNNTNENTNSNQANNQNNTNANNKQDNNQSNNQNNNQVQTIKPSPSQNNNNHTSQTKPQPTTTAITKVNSTTETNESYSYKYGTTIKKITYSYYDIYSDGSKRLVNSYDDYIYDYSTFNASTNDMRDEASSILSQNIGTINEVLSYVNQYRSEVGQPALVLDNTLTLAATIRSLEMGWSNTLSHTRPNGTDCFSIASELGITYYTIGENIASGYWDAASVANGWKNSPGHYSNMVSSGFTKIGIGVANVNGKYYWTQLFTN